MVLWLGRYPYKTRGNTKKWIFLMAMHNILLSKLVDINLLSLLLLATWLML